MTTIYTDLAQPDIAYNAIVKPQHLYRCQAAVHVYSNICANFHDTREWTVDREI